MWLIAYEATRNGWWPKAQSSDFITKHDYFSALWTAQVEFYDSGKKARTQVMCSLLAKAFELGSARYVMDNPLYARDMGGPLSLILLFYLCFTIYTDHPKWLHWSA